jgi:hypothetical protein
MPDLTFLPHGVTTMLAGRGGLLLFHGGMQSRVLLPDGDPQKFSKCDVDPVSVKPEHWMGEFPPQPMFVICNPITRRFRVLPPLDTVLTKVVARISVPSLSDSYIIHVVGWHENKKKLDAAEKPGEKKKAIKKSKKPKEIEYGEAPGVLKVGVYGSLENKWHFHPNLTPQPQKPFKPDFVELEVGSSGYRALPFVRCNEGPVFYIAGKVLDLTDDPKEPEKWTPGIMRYVFRKRVWDMEYWPSQETMESPQLVEVNEAPYVVSRTISLPRTFHVFKLVDYDLNMTEIYKGFMDLVNVSIMDPDMYKKCFLDHSSLDITTHYCCVGGMDRIWIMCHTLPVMVFYNVNTKFWELVPSIPMFASGRTVIGNWLYQPAIHAQL